MDLPYLREADMTLPVKHIGWLQALCDRRRKANLRTDLGVERYKQLGVKERFRDEAPYRICPACIKAVPHQWTRKARKPI